jgi:uncharacterized protein (TIGR01319 family)
MRRGGHPGRSGVPGSEWTIELVVAVDFGSTFTKAVAVDPSSGHVVTTARAPTTVETDIEHGLDAALARLRDGLGARPHTVSRFLASSSAAGGLRMVALGLVPALTAEAAKRAALCAGAKLLDTFAGPLSARELARLQGLDPEIVLLVGGTDGGNAAVILHNAQMLAASDLRAPIVYAGNKAAADEAEATLLAAGKDVQVTENVMPQLGQLNLDPARQVIGELFMSRIVEAKGIAKIRARVGDILMPTPAAVLSAAKLLSVGCPGEDGLGDLVVVDVGGATTDVHSIADGSPTRPEWLPKGLPEPHAKRTVEGDLGVRWNAEGILEAAGEDGVLAHMRPGTYGVVDLPRRARQLTERPETLAGSEAESDVDTALAAAAVDLAMERHAGRLETVYGLDGPVTLLFGKDLSRVRHLIGVGGVFARTEAAARILRCALRSPQDGVSTRPAEAALSVDDGYVFFAMGLLATVEQPLALRLLKRHLRHVGARP